MEKQAAVSSTSVPADATTPGSSATSVRCIFGFQHPKLALEPEDFELKIVRNKVLLSNCVFSSGIVVGTVVVANTQCHDRNVTVRYTTDEWKTFMDTAAIRSARASEGEDRFVFEVDMEGKTTLHFAICLHITNTEYWDNNDTKNYSLVLE